MINSAEEALEIKETVSAEETYVLKVVFGQVTWKNYEGMRRLLTSGTQGARGWGVLNILCWHGFLSNMEITLMENTYQFLKDKFTLVISEVLSLGFDFTLYAS